MHLWGVCPSGKTRSDKDRGNHTVITSFQEVWSHESWQDWGGSGGLWSDSNKARRLNQNQDVECQVKRSEIHYVQNRYQLDIF